MKLPKTIYLSRQNTESGHKDDEYLSATEDPADHGEKGVVVTVGRYELMEIGTVTAEPVFVSSGKVRR